MKKFRGASPYTPWACAWVYIGTMCVFSIYLGHTVAGMIPVLYPIIRSLAFAVICLICIYCSMVLGALMIEKVLGNG